MAINIVPQLWAARVIARMQIRGTLMSAGLVTFDSSPVFKDGDTVHRVPYLKSLDTVGDDEKIVRDQEGNFSTISDYLGLGPILRRKKQFKFDDLDTIIAGTNGSEVMSSQIGDYWIRQYEKKLGSVTKGAYTTALATSHTLDATADSVIDSDHILDARQIMGENKDLLTKFICHSKVATDLSKQGLVEYVDAGNFGQSILLTGRIPTFMGMMIVELDHFCAPFTVDADPDYTAYPSYLAGGQPFYIGFQRGLKFASKREEFIGDGQDFFKVSAHYSPALKGVSWKTTATNVNDPDVADLETGANWESIAQNVTDIPLVRLLNKST